MSLRDRAIRLKASGLTYAEVGRVLRISTASASALIKPPEITRRAIVARAGGKCERCEKVLTNGHLHHKEYRWDYNSHDNIEYLCASCHTKHHKSTSTTQTSMAARVFQPITHNCPRGVVFTWIPRVENPKQCPRCRAWLKSA